MDDHDWQANSASSRRSREGDVGDAVVGDSVDVDFGGGFSAVPAGPEDDALAVGGDGGDEVVRAGEEAEAAMHGLEMGDQSVFAAEAEDGAFVGRQQEAG